MNNLRHEQACKAHEAPALATDQQLMDGLALRLKNITEGDSDTNEGARYVASILMGELAKRHHIEVRVH